MLPINQQIYCFSQTLMTPKYHFLTKYLYFSDLNKRSNLSFTLFYKVRNSRMCQKYLCLFVSFCKTLIVEALRCCCNGKSSLLFSGSCGFPKTAFQKSGYVIDPILLKKKKKKVIQLRSGLAFTHLLISGRMTLGQKSVWVSWRNSFITICSWKSSLFKIAQNLQ